LGIKESRGINMKKVKILMGYGIDPALEKSIEEKLNDDYKIEKMTTTYSPVNERLTHAVLMVKE
jgi:hypothetical protein